VVDLLMNFPVVTTGNFPHGLSCMDCGRVITEGQPYGAGMPEYVDGHELVELRCVYC
jgi:hypothetical protein